MKYVSKEDPNIVVEAGVIKNLAPTRVPGHTGLDCMVSFDAELSDDRVNISADVAASATAEIKVGDFVIVDGVTVKRVFEASIFTDAYDLIPADEFKDGQLGDEGDDSLDEPTEEEKEAE